jgi:alpha-D-xyloside xylohydrolase
MRFDEEYYPDPAQMIRDLHGMNMKLMISVWSKIDPSCEIGKEAQKKGVFIPGTTWIDFFDPEASAFYWNNFRDRLLKPYGIDAWWQDATEPENDDLEGRRIMKGTQPGERFRNVYPLKVTQTIYEGLRKDDPERRPMIFTRSGFSGAQRYGAILWSGDVGNDWQTLRYQISAGLGFVSSGLPWWTFDAGGFFRPHDQYTDAGYIERMIRWVQASTFLPIMRVHGYMSDTEPWRYGEQAQRLISKQIELRYRLFPYIYSEAAKVTYEGSTLLRPFIFDFPEDEIALEQDNEFMFGHSLLVCPVTEGGASRWKVYLPYNKGGWYDFFTGKRYDGGCHIDVPISMEAIPVFAKAGSIIPVGAVRQSVTEKESEPLTLNIYPGSDAIFHLYEDEGDNMNYMSLQRNIIEMRWEDSARKLIIEHRQGHFDGMQEIRTFNIAVEGTVKTIRYDGNKTVVRF